MKRTYQPSKRKRSE